MTAVSHEISRQARAPVTQPGTLERTGRQVIDVEMPAEPEHRYQCCRDDRCLSALCQAYKAGFRRGWDIGYDAGDREHDDD